MSKKATIIAVVNQKGGTGKTTTTENLGVGLALEGKKVLLVDTDPQASLTVSLGNPCPDDLSPTLSDLMGKIMMENPITPDEGILHHPEGVDLVPSNIELSGMEVALVNAMSRETILRQYLDASEDFMDEIKDVIAGLIQNYEVIRDSEVMMSKEANSIGKCPLCGSAVEDKAKAFFCSNRACKFALWKNNRYFASIGKSMTSATAQKLLGSGKVKLKNCKSERTGNTFDATVFMEVSDDGKTKFSMEFENGGKRK